MKNEKKLKEARFFIRFLGTYLFILNVIGSLLLLNIETENNLIITGVIIFILNLFFTGSIFLAVVFFKEGGEE